MLVTSSPLPQTQRYRPVPAKTTSPRPEIPARKGQQPSEATGFRHFARQPILTADGRLHAYELLFRDQPATAFSGNGVDATRTMIDNIVMFGLKRMTGGVPVFINCTLESLTRSFVEVLPPAMTILEILETLEPTPELIAACQTLKARGYRIALDDFVWRPDLAPLVEIADIIKVDFIQSGPAERRALIELVKDLPVQLLAEKVETLDEFEQARAEGFLYFQGYYFCRPTLVSSGEIPPNKLAQLELLRALQRDNFDLQKVSKLVEQDAAITYRLLRIVNSPFYAYRRRVRTVETALIVIGENAFRRLATLAIATAISTEASPTLLRTALARARFCELAAPLLGLDEIEQYLLGLFSLLPAMLRYPMDQVIASFDLRAQVREALMGEKNNERSLLCWMEANERGDWATCTAIEELHQISQSQFGPLAEEAVDWTEKTLHSAI